MAMGTRKRQERQEDLWTAGAELPRRAGHPFYERLNELLEQSGFDHFVEERCRPFYAAKMGWPSLAPGVYFRLLLIGYFEGLDSERGMAWHAADSLGLRRFLRIGLEEMAPDHSTISRCGRTARSRSGSTVTGKEKRASRAPCVAIGGASGASA